MKTTSSLFLKDSVTEFGKSRVNPYASQKNVLKLTDTCECTTETVCQDSLVIGFTEADLSILSVTFDGITYLSSQQVKDLNGDVRYEVLGTLNVFDVANWPVIIEWLTAIADIKEVDPKITLEFTPTGNLLIKHIGAKSFSSLTLSDSGVEVLTERCCTVANYNQFKFYAEGVIGDIDWNGEGAIPLANNPYDYTGDTATDLLTAQQLAEDLEAALTTLGVPNLKDVAVKVNNSTGQYMMSYWSTSNIAAYVGTVKCTICDAKVAFTCASLDIPVIV